MAAQYPNGRWHVTRLSSGDWHPEEIKAAVRIKGGTLTGLARQSGLVENACRVAIDRPHFDGEMAIAEYLSLSPRTIWPSRFRRNGTRIPDVRVSRTRKKVNADRRTDTSQIDAHLADMECAA